MKLSYNLSENVFKLSLNLAFLAALNLDYPSLIRTIRNSQNSLRLVISTDG